MEDYTEEESKVDVDEASVNLNCIKNEVAEFEENLHITQYRITYKFENIFTVASRYGNVEYEDNLIGFLDNDAMMENVVIKLEGIKKEGGNFPYCNKCNGIYKGFCLKCSTLSHILNNASPLTNPLLEMNTVPVDVLEIRDISMGKGVFLLKSLPKNIIFGPFEGISAMRNANGDGWKINNNRLENAENGNWMKDIACAASASIKNLNIFQIKENLYFQSNREIMEGEELLVYYDDEGLQKSDHSQECYFIPQKQEKQSKIFACTLCCLGFQLVKCLMEHKSKCPHAQSNIDIKDFELVECHYCNIWLEKQEHEKYHMGYCLLEKYHKILDDDSQPVDRSEVNVEKKEDRPNTKDNIEEYKCSQCIYETNCKKNLQKHLNRHKKLFQCDICRAKFAFRDNLKRHMKTKHPKVEGAKDYQCSECLFRTNYKYNLQMHLNRHKGIKPFQCNICELKFGHHDSLKRHLKDKHSEITSATTYQCSECSFQTNYQHSLIVHVNTHRGVKPYQCDICMIKLTRNSQLKKHIKNKHSEIGNTKEYQCSECSYQTNDRPHLIGHLNVHRGIKKYECDTCKKKFTEKRRLSTHIKVKHTENDSTKDYQCPECPFQTNYNNSLSDHMKIHSGIRPHQCEFCSKKFIKKSDLTRHLSKHAEYKSAKDYLCSECGFQTNDKCNLKIHMNAHRGIKPFECDICKIKYTTRAHLNKHIKNKHTENGSAKDHRCSLCSFKTNYRSSLIRHMNSHMGIRAYQCDICMMKFMQNAHLKIHIKKKHVESGI